MQTSINPTLAFGIPGEMYDLTPRRVDAIEVPAEVTIGGIAGKKSSNDGTVGPIGSTYSVPCGVFVRPHEQVSYGTSDGALYPTMKVPAGTTVQVCSMGRVIMAIPFSATHTVATASYDKDTEEKEAIKAFANLTASTYEPAEGDSAYVDTNGGTYELTKVSTSNTLFGKFIKGAKISDAIKSAEANTTTGAFNPNKVVFTKSTQSTNTITKATIYSLVVVQLG